MGFSTGEETNNIRVSVHCTVRTKRFIKIPVRKLSILALKCTFLGHFKLKQMKPVMCTEHKDIFIVLGICNFVYREKEQT